MHSILHLLASRTDRMRTFNVLFVSCVCLLVPMTYENFAPEVPTLLFVFFFGSLFKLKVSAKKDFPSPAPGLLTFEGPNFAISVGKHLCACHQHVTFVCLRLALRLLCLIRCLFVCWFAWFFLVWLRCCFCLCCIPLSLSWLFSYVFLRFLLILFWLFEWQYLVGVVAVVVCSDRT